VNDLENIILRASHAACARVLQSGEPSRIESASIDFKAGSFTLLCGGEGCGKNILLRLLGLLEVPDAGEIFFNGNPTRGLPETARADLRNRHFGFLFAEPFLLPSFSAVENIAMPLLKISGVTTEEARRRTLALLDFAGIPDTGENDASQLPLFDQHKVALARALANQPAVLIVENPDAALGGSDLAEFAALLRRAAAEFGTAVIATVSSASLAPIADRVARVANGRLSPGEGSAVGQEGARPW
jgi:ABC-type lipoprotein export system ATPase subunit